MDLVPMMVLFNAKKHRRQRLARAMAMGLMPVAAESQRQAFTAISADMEVRRSERAEEQAVRETAQVIIGAAQRNGKLTDVDLAGAPALRRLLERNPSLRQSVDAAVASRSIAPGNDSLGISVTDDGGVRPADTGPE